MTDAYDPFGPAPFAKPRRGRPSKPKLPVAVEPDPFATTPADCRLSALPTNDGITPLRAATRRPKLSLVQGRTQRQAQALVDDDPFPVPPDQPSAPAMPTLAANRRCTLDDPFTATLRLPFVLVERNWQGGLVIHLVKVDGKSQRRSTRFRDEERVLREAEVFAVEKQAMLVSPVLSSLVWAGVESAIAATVFAMKADAG